MDYIKLTKTKKSISLFILIIIAFSIMLGSCESNINNNISISSNISVVSEMPSDKPSSTFESEAKEPTTVPPEPAITTVPVVKINYTKVVPPENMKPKLPKSFLVSNDSRIIKNLINLESKDEALAKLILWTSPDTGDAYESDGAFYLKNIPKNTNLTNVGYAFLIFSKNKSDYAYIFTAKVEENSSTGKIIFEKNETDELPPLTRQLSIVSPRNPLTQIQTDDTSDLLVFDPKQYAIPEKAPYMLREVCIAPLLNMLKVAENEGNPNITIRDTYRGYSIQAKMFNAGVQKRVSWGMDYYESFKETDRRTAFPGTSEHHDGYTLDIVTADSKLDQNFGRTKFGRWLSDNSFKYGFIIRYTQIKEEQTTKFYEPWHVRYVGEPAAFIINEFDLALEEFHAWLEKNKYLPYRYKNAKENDCIFIHASSQNNINVPKELLNDNRLFISEKGDDEFILQFQLD